MTLTLADKALCYNPPAAEISMLYTFLPTVVKSRLPVLNSFRRSMKITTMRGSNPSHSRQLSEDSLHGFTSSNNGYEDPNHEVVTREQLWEVSRRPRDPSAELTASTTSSSTPSSTASSQTAVAPLDFALARPIHETSTGVEWDTAVTALLLLSKACTRAQHPDAKPENTRALIVDANKWLLRSLPEQLDSQELEEIEQVLPIGLDNPDRAMYRQTRRKSRASRSDRRPWLRRCIAFVILQTSFLVALVIPYLTALISSCYGVERRNHITERLLTGGIDFTNVVGESGMEVKDALVRLSRGRMVSALVQTAGGIIESVIGGISDGAGDGVSIVGEAMLSREGRQME